MNYYSNLTDQCAGDSRKLFRVVILCLKTLYPDALTRYLRRQISSLRRQIGHVISAMRQGLLSCRRHIGKREDPGDEVVSYPDLTLFYRGRSGYEITRPPQNVKLGIFTS